MGANEGFAFCFRVAALFVAGEADCDQPIAKDFVAIANGYHDVVLGGDDFVAAGFAGVLVIMRGLPTVNGVSPSVANQLFASKGAHNLNLLKLYHTYGKKSRDSMKKISLSSGRNMV